MQQEQREWSAEHRKVLKRQRQHVNSCLQIHWHSCHLKMGLQVPCPWIRLTLVMGPAGVYDRDTMWLSQLWDIQNHRGQHAPLLVCKCEVSHFSHVSFCDTVDCSPTGSSVHDILQERILECVAMPSSREPSCPGTEPVSLTSPGLAGGFFTTSAAWEAPHSI